MPTHWTYFQFEPENDLAQGDILWPTDELRQILKEVHPHFLDAKYTAFLLTTQSCDIVRRKGHCNTRYLNLAVIRSLEDVLHDILSQVCNPIRQGIYTHESKNEANRLLVRVFNQNEQVLGLFYLHQDADAGIAVPSVALLRVSVTLRVDHYDVIMKARRGSLSPEFRGKLGWLVGNLYSRIGTQDWTESQQRQAELKRLVDDVLTERDLNSPKWVKESWIRAAQARGLDLSQIPLENFMVQIEQHKPPTAKEATIEHTLRVIKELIPGIEDTILQKIHNRLQNDQAFGKAVRSAKLE
jgi:hypothetical protein